MQFEMTEKEPRVIPFSNGTQAMIWQDHNCDCCAKRYDEAKDEAHCPMEESLAFGSVVGDIPLEAAQRIGWTPHQQGRFGDLARRCKEFEEEKGAL